MMRRVGPLALAFGFLASLAGASPQSAKSAAPGPTPSRPNIAMRLGVARGGQVQDALGALFKSLQEFPPRQEGGSLRPGS